MPGKGRLGGKNGMCKGPEAGKHTAPCWSGVSPVWASHGLPRWRTGKESTCQCMMQEAQVQSWVGKIPWRRTWQSTPAFLLGKPHGERRLENYSHGVTKSWTRLSMHHKSAV